MGDGHCMYRAIGKILQKQPGEMMQEVRTHMLSMNSCTEYYLVEREVTKRESRYTAMMNVRHNKRGVRIHETEWGEPEDCVAIAKWSGRDVIILHTETDRCTIIPYTPNAIETKTVAKLMTLNWTREPSRGKHGIYLIHDGIHYNALSLRDDQEEGEQDEESSIGEYTNQTQQKRTTEHATPTQCIHNNLLKDNTHEEEDGSRTQDKTNEKGKRKSERHEALCEAEHRKTKKEKTDSKAQPTEA